MEHKVYFTVILSMVFILSSCTNFESESEKNIFMETLSIEQQYNSYEDEEAYYYFENGIRQMEKYENTIRSIPNTENAEKWYVYGDFIYFSTKNRDICRIKTNGEYFEILLNMMPFISYDMEPVVGIFVLSDKLFIQMSFELYLYDMKTGETDLISQDARTVRQLNNNLYFCGRDYSIHEFNSQTKEEKLLFKSEYSEDKGYYGDLYKNFIFIGDNLYYYLRSDYGNGLYCFDGEKSTLISDKENINEFSLCEYREELYFVEFRNPDGSESLFKYNPSDERITRLFVLEDYSRDAKVMDGYFYYKTFDFKLKKIKIPEIP